MGKQSRSKKAKKEALARALILQSDIPFRDARGDLCYAQPDGRIMHADQRKHAKARAKVKNEVFSEQYGISTPGIFANDEYEPIPNEYAHRGGNVKRGKHKWPRTMKTT